MPELGEAESQQSAVVPTDLPKVPTGNIGLDRILRGGLPKSRTTLLSGGPGCGKSLLALEFVVRGAQAGEPGIFVPFEERLDAVRANALTLGWDLEKLERDQLLFLVDARVDHESLRSGDFDLKGLLAIVEGISRTIGSHRVCLDAIDALLRLYNDAAREREQLLILNDWLLDHGFTTVLTVKRGETQDPNSHYEFLDYLADCVIHLDQRVTSQLATRRLRVIKYRGSGYGRNEYPYVITETGVRIIPISSVELRHKGLGAPVSTGVTGLDEMMGGGYLLGSSILIAGAAGTGKTTLASIFTCSATSRKEKVLYVGFEESIEAIVSAMLSSGTDLRPALKAGFLRALTAIPESMGSEEHLLRIIDAIEEFCPRHVVVDALSASRRMGSERAAFEFLVRLLNVCRDKGITTLLMNQTVGVKQASEVAGEEISSLVDTILFLRYVEIGGEVNRLIVVAKARGSGHSNQIREFRITDNGIEFANVYAGPGGVLTGVARQEQEAADAAERRRVKAMIEAKRAEVARRAAELDAETNRLRAAMEQARIELAELEADDASAKHGEALRLEMRSPDSRNGNANEV